MKTEDVVSNHKPGQSGIARPTKFLNRQHKAANHRANLQHRADVSRDFANASKNSSKVGVPHVAVVNPAGPYRPRRY